MIMKISDMLASQYTNANKTMEAVKEEVLYYANYLQKQYPKMDKAKFVQNIYNKVKGE